jgi:hypothetical protein
MREPTLKFVTVLATLLAAAFLLPQRAAADEDDPPGRVARLSYTDGSVSFNPAGTEDWVTGVINRPVTTGDKLWADRDSRAELQIGNASIRMGSSTGFSFLDLNDNITQLQLTDGTLRIRVRRLARDEQFEIDTPNLAFSILHPGIYKINVNEAGDTTMVEVRSGEGEVTGGGQSYEVREGESGAFYGTDQLNADIQGLQDDDDFDAWSDERDRREDHSVSGRYVSQDAVGYEDLDDYGGWRDTPEYGTIWFPHTTVVGWAPYRYGHWVYILPWGYTWVEDEPWGYAPFHYGRWVVVGGAWGWVPCRPAAVEVAYVRPVYAPALVAWVGGPHFAIGVGVGGAATVGWFPLGPREVYAPSYQVSRTYVNNVNITNTSVNTTVINNYYNTTVVNNNNTTVANVHYVNRGVPGAVTAASARSVATAQPISRNIVRVDERQLASAPVVVRAPTVAPERQAVLGAGRPGAVRPPSQVATRQIVAKTTPPPPPPRFETQQALIKQNGGQPPALSDVRQKYTNDAHQSQVRIAPPARPGTPQTAGNRPNAPENNRPNNTPQNNERPAMERPNSAPQNQQANAPQNNQRPANDRSSNTPQNLPSNANSQPANNQRQYNDRPPMSRPSNTPPPNQSRNGQQLEQQHQQELENMHRQQDQQRQQLEQRQQQERQQLDQQRANQQRQQQLEQQHQQQLQELQRQHQAQQQQVNQRQEQEHQQQRQQDRPPQQSRPPQQERPAPSRPQQQQEHSKPADKPSKP